MTTQPEPRWTLDGRTANYQGRVRLVDHSVRTADGTPLHYEVDESIPFGVATLIVDGDTVLLTRQYRYPIDRWIYDLPGGAGDDGETPEAAARRELEEELGLVPDDLVPLHTFFANPGRAAWPVHLFVCRRGTTSGVADHSDPAEEVRLAPMNVGRLDSLIRCGEIVDPSLLIARTLAAVHGYLPPLTSSTA